jgi:predicted outer membrane repeat protein
VGSELLLDNNTAARSGGGLYLSERVVIHVAKTAKSTFKSNKAILGNGGGLAFDDWDGLQDGRSNCVKVKLTIKLGGTHHQEKLSMYTVPNSPLEVVEDRDKIATEHDTKVTEWCIPCGKYEFTIDTAGWASVKFPKSSFISLKVSGNKKITTDVLLFQKELSEMQKVKVENVRILCSDQSVFLANTKFEFNEAGLNGGAIATADNYKNAFFDLKNVKFLHNIAGGQGGAIRASGSQTAVQGE